ncbi:MAG: trehalose synthase [Chloroflexi bacterium]|nr:trehalose synthase [Chloroflexota bacterium]
MRHTELWYKTAIIYCLDVKTFQDANGDGVGDFEGLIESLNYIASLGVNTLWLMPFYPSPNRDNGYDVADYYGVDPRLGTLGDFVEFTHQAHNHGLRVLIDLVINHTSVDHPWFQAARQNRNSRYHDYYIWSDEKPEDADEGVIFPGVQESTWTYDEQAGQYYFHRFYHHQPDLNISNLDVQEEIRKIMGFWLELGVNGFRMDAAPFVIEMRDLESGSFESRDSYLEYFRHFLSWRRGNAIMLAEANVPMDHVPRYFGDGDRMHMLFNFMANQHLYLAFARNSAEPLIEGLNQLPETPALGQWAQFLRNHDELSLDKLSDADREEVFAAFAPDEDMRIYDRGIRRRLAPILENDRRRLELAHSLLLTLPGTPVIYYGQEIGMGDDLSLPERMGVRTPMQWSADKNGGFSTADPKQLIRPVVSRGEFGYERVNVTAQRRDDSSLMRCVQRMIVTRRQCPEFGIGRFELLDPGDPRLLAHRSEWEDGTVIAVHNFSDEPLTARLKTGEAIALIDLLSNREYETNGHEEHAIEIAPYGYRWFRVKHDGMIY